MGTLDEIFEILTLKQLQFHKKPVVFINTEGFFNKLFEFFDFSLKQGFLGDKDKNLYFISSSAEDAILYIKGEFYEE